ncbi:MAG TPA: SDR family oxidoreductase [Asanoa sp.]|nr:SDR family oxidoreductase [Asanoa sp.]
MSIVITGATGQLGRLVAADLVGAGVPADQITVVARDPEKAADLVALGHRLHVADYDDPATFGGAFQAADRVLLISASQLGRRTAQHKAVIDAATAAGVAQLAYTGVFGGPKAWFKLADEHRDTEQLILDSGLPHTFLRHNWYSEGYTADLAGVIERGAIVNAIDPTARVATVPRIDFAAAAAKVLTTEGHLNRAYELSGDTAWTFGEFAAEVTRRSGSTVVHSPISTAELKANLTGAGVPEFVADILVEVDEAISKGALAGTPGELSALIGRPTTPIGETIAAELAALGR